MKTTFVATVLNEEKNIEEFLNSLSSQSKKPSEIIIVDAGSTDNTRNIIKKYKNIKLFVRIGNRSVGRNFAIKKAEGEVIIASDSGCILHEDFIKNIISPFANKKIDVASGFYYPITNNIFEKCLATYTCVMPDRIDPKKFLPSSRAIAFRKSSWEKVGGYPEHLDTCEDLMFAKKLKSKNYNLLFKKNAYVYWYQKKNITGAFKQLHGYALGDGQARYFRPTTPLIFLRYLIGYLILVITITSKSYSLFFLIAVLLILYIVWSVQKNYKYIKHWNAFIYLPLLQFTADFAVILGMTKGLMQKRK